MSVVLTGLGYIGSALLPDLAERGERILAVENFYCTPRSAVERVARLHGAEVVEGDVADAACVDDVFRRVAEHDGGPLRVFHLAAQPSAADAARDPAYTERTNLTGARMVLEAARRHGATRVVFGGSFRVYGDDLDGRVVDERTAYGRVGDLSHLSKVYVEQLARMAGVPFVSVRLGVTYGLAPIMKAAESFMTVPNLFCQRAVRGESPRILEDRAMGFIHVEDAARALAAAADLPLGTDEPWQAVNAVGEVATIGQVGRLVARCGAERGLQVRVEGSAGATETFQVRSGLDESGYRPQQTLEGTLGEVLDYFLEGERAAA